MMFTKIDKAIVALIMAAIFLLSSNGIALPEFLTEEWVTNAVALLTPLAVWAVPNKGET